MRDRISIQPQTTAPPAGPLEYRPVSPVLSDTSEPISKSPTGEKDSAVMAVTAFPGKLGHTSSWQVTHMLRLNETTRVKLMTIHGFAMLALGMSLFYVRATMTNLLFNVVGGAFAMLLVAASLLFIAGVDWLCAAGLGRRQVSRLRGLLFLSSAVAVSGVLLILYPGATIRMLCYLLAVYALLLSVGKFGLARAWIGTQRQQVVMYILAVIAVAFGAALIVFAGQDERDALVVVAAYSLFMGFQMLLTMYFLLQQPEDKPSEPSSALNGQACKGI
jgi:hypothetical protein